MSLFNRNYYSKRVLLKLGTGSLEAGFPEIIGQIDQPGSSSFAQNVGSLPPALKLRQYYQEWRRVYVASCYNPPHLSEFQLDNSSIPAVRALELNIDEKDELDQFPEEEFKQLSDTLRQELNEWLQEKSFANLEKWLCRIFTPNDYLQIIIEVEDAEARRFPWHLWDFFEHYPRAELSLSTLRHSRGPQTRLGRRNRLRILAIVGDTTRTEGDKDLQLLVDRFRNTKVKITPLIQPSWENLNRQLRNKKGWDILFFAGHSATYDSGDDGYLKLNTEDRISVSDFRNALRVAIEKGLKLAILNSCDGIGLAKKLDDLNLPQTIVMRERVLDKVAQRFIFYLLSALQEQPLLSAMREARENLEELEGEFNCATWLPVMFQNPSFDADLIRFPLARPRISRKHLARVFLASFLLSALVIGWRWQGKLQVSELHAYDNLVQYQPSAQIDERIILILVDKDDRKIFGNPSPQQTTTLLPEHLEKLVSILTKHKPSIIGLDIFQRDHVLGDKTPIFSQKVEDGEVVLICEPSSIYGEADPVEAPKNAPPAAMGAASILEDRDKLGDKGSGIVRRQLLKIQDNERLCGSRNIEALSLKLASHYLEKVKGKKRLDSPEDDFVKFGDLVFNPLKIHQGPYHEENILGHDESVQIILNYLPYRNINSGPFKSVRVSDVLKGHVDESDFKEKIVLIGPNINPPLNSYADRFLTPMSRKGDYVSSNRVPGVFLHAQMTSHLITAVESGKHGIWIWPSWGDGLWILGWGITSGMTVLVVVYGKSYMMLIFQTLAVLAALSLILYLSCWIFLLTGGWVPFIPSLLSIIISGHAVLFYLLAARIRVRLLV